MPIYDFTTISRQPKTKQLIPCKFIIFEVLNHFMIFDNKFNEYENCC